MPRFEEPALRRLPVLEPRKRALETCVYCPKLCRSACPVSNAEPRETIIPWGKMSTAYFVARGTAPLDASFAAPAWACTGCGACSEACDHRNDVAGTLLDARAAFVARGVAPDAATRAIARFGAHRDETARAVDSLQNARVSNGKSPAFLIGCTYARKLPDAARAAIAIAERVLGSVVLERECCGLPLKLAGDASAYEAHVARFSKREIVAHDPGCARALRATGARVTLLVELVAERLHDLREGPIPEDARAVRYHDPCHLGRGLGVYDAPRAILTRVTGRAPLELTARRERAPCSGAGGLLPLTMPSASREIARAVRAEHDDLARTDHARELVTACGSSALRLGARDWTELVAFRDA